MFASIHHNAIFKVKRFRRLQIMIGECYNGLKDHLFILMHINVIVFSTA